MSENQNIVNCNNCNSSSLCFKYLKPDELEYLNNKKTQLLYKKGENLFKQGAFSPFVIQIIEGMVMVYLQTGYNKQINIRIAQKGDLLGFSSVFGDNIHNYSAAALKDSKICMIDKNALKHLMLINPEFGFRITSEYCRNESQLLEMIKNISFKQMRGKLATALLYLSGNEYKDDNIFNYLSRQDIADFASVSTESAIKFLKEFEKEKILKLKRKDITVINIDKLKEIAERG